MNDLRSLGVFVFFIFLVFTVHAQAEVKEHPLIRPFPGSIVDPHGSYQDFAEYSFRVTDAETGKAVKKTVQGKYWKLTYCLRDASGRFNDRTHSVLEFRENYKQAALEKGGTILYEDQGYLTFNLPGDDGGTTWCEVHIWNFSQQDLRIIEEAGMQKRLTFGPAEMKAALDAEGYVRLQGILFDLDQATLQPESTKQLQHVLALLKNHPDLNLEVQGHTDDQGSESHNLNLSQQRAETVVAYLTLFGIDPGRLSPKGFGESQPVMPNTTEEGRAQNRRVELVKPISSDAPGKEDVPKDIAELIVGKWKISPNKRAKAGSIVFNKNRTYEMNEKFHDGTGAGTKGEYKLNSKVTPITIDLCLGQCGQPGSEWTTRFGILNVLSNDMLEIYISPDGKYASDFANDLTDGNTLMLTRVK